MSAPAYPEEQVPLGGRLVRQLALVPRTGPRTGPQPGPAATVAPMGDIDDLRARLAALEAELPAIREEAAAARALAAGADRDVAEYRAEMRSQTRLLSAIRETQVTERVELKGDIAELRAGITTVVGMLERLGDTGR
jgi:hypothetical protein